MKPDENIIAAAEKLIGDSPLRGKLNGRIDDYRAACERDDEEGAKRSLFDIEYLSFKMARDGEVKPVEEQIQGKEFCDRKEREAKDKEPRP